MSYWRIWLLDANDRLPKSAQFIGLDISFDAAPPPEALPSNITFQKWDVREPVPDELVGAFDIVNVRFMLFVLLREEVPATVDKLSQMLSESDYYLPHLMPLGISIFTNHLETHHRLQSLAGICNGLSPTTRPYTEN